MSTEPSSPSQASTETLGEVPSGPQVAAVVPTPDTYTIILRGQSFPLSASQIAYDSPSFFTTAFDSGGFVESATRVVHSDRRPEVFAIILEYLSGYEVLPVKLAGRTARESVRMLRLDADYFGLEGLVKKVDEWLASERRFTAYPVAQGYATFKQGIISFRSFLRMKGPEVQQRKGLAFHSLLEASLEPFGTQLFHFQDLLVEISEAGSKVRVTFLDPQEWETRKEVQRYKSSDAYVDPVGKLIERRIDRVESSSLMRRDNAARGQSDETPDQPFARVDAVYHADRTHSLPRS